jgi:hypothetical protein
MKKVSFSKYKAGEGCCPRCHSCEVTGSQFDTDIGITSQEVVCDECGLSWTDEYTLTSISNVYDDSDEEFVVVD